MPSTAKTYESSGSIDANLSFPGACRHAEYSQIQGCIPCVEVANPVRGQVGLLGTLFEDHSLREAVTLDLIDPDC